ncbi:Bug family tripartite tricarboxylate transporter substrate binding protein [Pseudonocardia sichuanensis]
MAALSLPFALVLAGCAGAEEAPTSTDAPAAGQWPGEMTLYIPNAPGGGFDIAARALQPALAEQLGESVVPTNLEGAGGAIAATQMLDDPADGTAMMITSRSIASVPYTGTPEIDPVLHLAPIGVTHQDVSALTVRADAPYDTVAEFLDHARANPGGVRIGTAGTGGVWHAAGLLLARAAGVEFTFIPYDGGSSAGNALVAGEIDAVTIGAPETRPFVEGGDARMLAVMGEERSSLYPDVPTLQEQGIDVTYAVWRGYVVDAETPEPIRLELAERVRAAAEDPAYQTAMAGAGFETTWIGPAEFGELITQEDELIRQLFAGEDFMTTRPERVPN